MVGDVPEKRLSRPSAVAPPVPLLYRRLCEPLTRDCTENAIL
jgi:hypothetical protein